MLQGGESADGILPPFVVGESGPHTPATKADLSHRNRIPKVRFCAPWSLAGKTVDDEDLREPSEGERHRRPSTRAAIIETLFKRHYIAPQGKSITVSQAGIELIATIK